MRLGASGTSFQATALADIKDSIDILKAAGCEIGLHGIDAWCDGAKAREEMEQLQRFAQSERCGVRMHWLYFDQQSPAILDNAGADYDSTAGYNEAIGYRSGTAQAYKPAGIRTPSRAASDHHGYGAVLPQASEPFGRSRREIR